MEPNNVCQGRKWRGRFTFAQPVKKNAEDGWTKVLETLFSLYNLVPDPKKHWIWVSVVCLCCYITYWLLPDMSQVAWHWYRFNHLYRLLWLALLIYLHETQQKISMGLNLFNSKRCSTLSFSWVWVPQRHFGLLNDCVVAHKLSSAKENVMSQDCQNSFWKWLSLCSRNRKQKWYEDTWFTLFRL